jgi:hypothetical protein
MQSYIALYTTSDADPAKVGVSGPTARDPRGFQPSQQEHTRMANHPEELILEVEELEERTTPHIIWEP